MSVSEFCRLLGITRQWYYVLRKRPGGEKILDDARMEAEIWRLLPAKHLQDEWRRYLKKTGLARRSGRPTKVKVR